MTEGCRYRSHYNPFNVVSHASFSPDPEGDLIEYSEYQKLEAENSKLKVSIELARSDALSNLERLISVEAENKRLREALREIMETDAEHLSYRIARRTLAASVGKYAGQPEHEAAGWQPDGGEG